MLSRGDVHDPVHRGAHDHGAGGAHERRPARSPRSTSCRSAAATTRHVLDALERNKRYLRGEIARRVNLKFAPDIRFRIDERSRRSRTDREAFANTRGPPRPCRRRGRVMAAHRIPPLAGSAAPAEQSEWSGAKQKKRRQARRARLDRARQAGRHDLDARRVGDQASVYRRSAPAMPARSIRSPPAVCRSRSARRPRPCRS